VWFDVDRDQVHDSNEPLLIDTLVELRPSERGRHRVGRGGELRPSGSADDADRRRSGRYAFTGLELGDYVVVATVPAEGIERSYDSDGTVDWTVAVEVLADRPGVADFAGVGNGALGGQLLNTSGTPVKVATDVLCTWAGVDGVLGTA
jgi:hypothetical protein